jgi:hypothetical protein
MTDSLISVVVMHLEVPPDWNFVAVVCPICFPPPYVSLQRVNKFEFAEICPRCDTLVIARRPGWEIGNG